MMTLDSQWKLKYEVLRDFLSSNPEIHIGQAEVCIPENLRGSFFGFFDEIRGALVESWQRSLAFDVHSLSKNFLAAESALSEKLKIRLALAMDLSSFLRTPKEGMMRLIYNRLFERIQGKISEADFEKMAERDLAAETTAMFRLGYETWAALALVVMLEPDAIAGLALDSDQKPVVTEIKEIAFGRQFHHPAKRVPEFIFHSKKLDCYIAFKMPLAREVLSYRIPDEIPTQRLLRNRNGDTSSALDHRMIFLSVVKDLKETPVFADIHERTVTSPDLTVEFLLERDLSDPEIMGQIQNRLEIMKPRFGGVLALMDSASKPEFLKIAANIDAVSVGLEPSRLRPVIDKLVPQSFITSASDGIEKVFAF